MKAINAIRMGGMEVLPLIEGGKGISISNGISSGNWAFTGGVGTFSAVNADSYDAGGQRIPQVYHGRTRRERHEELVAYSVRGAVAQARQAYEMAGLKPSDINVLELYDAFTINTILFLEDLGFCEKGEGGPFVSGGRIAPGGSPGGSLPVNTNGGGLSYCHPGMYGLFLLIEAVRQLRGECGARQVPEAETAIAHGNGGVLSSQSTVILGSSATV